MIKDKINQTIILKDGRALGFAEYGVSTGIPVFHFHGSASSRLERPSSEIVLNEFNIRFLTIDRPGHGLSDFQPGRCLIHWSQDIEQLADQLVINEFYVMGHSAGGPHMLASAHQLPERVIAGAVISSVAPMNRPNAYKGMPVLNQILARASRGFPWFTKLIRWTMRKMAMTDVEKSTQQLMSSISESDKEVLYDPKNVEILVLSIREGFCQGHRGVAQDDILVNGDWGFSLENIKPRIDIWHGEADLNVPFHAGKFLSAKLPNNREMFMPDKGHFFVLSHWKKILSKLVDGK